MNTAYRDPITWPLLPALQDGRLTYPPLERSVRELIQIILTTRPGEQLMRPRFGAGLQNFLDEGNTISVRRQIQSAIQDNLQRYEPRIAVDRIDVDPVAGAPPQIHVQIYYRVLRTNTSQQVGVTMRVE